MKNRTRVIIKKTLEKVIEIEHDEGMDKSEILELVQRDYYDGEISLNLNDYRGEDSIAECINCSKITIKPENFFIIEHDTIIQK